MGGTHTVQLPGSEAGALQQGPRLQGQGLGQLAPLVQGLDHGQGRAPLHRGQAAGVADCHGPHVGAAHQVEHQVGAEAAHGDRRGQLLVTDGESLGQHGVETLGSAGRGPVHHAGQIHRGGSGLAQLGYRVVEGWAAGAVGPHGQRHPESAGHADGGGAPHRQALDGGHHVTNGVDAQHGVGAGQSGLVDHLDRAVGPADPVQCPQPAAVHGLSRLVGALKANRSV